MVVNGVNGNNGHVNGHIAANFNSECDNSDEVFLFTSESVGEGHSGENRFERKKNLNEKSSE